MQTVAETPTFSRQADKLFSEDEKRELIDFLAENPLAGDEIPGQARRSAGDLLLPGRSNAGLRAARLCEDRENAHDTG